MRFGFGLHNAESTVYYLLLLLLTVDCWHLQFSICLFSHCLMCTKSYTQHTIHNTIFHEERTNNGICCIFIQQAKMDSQCSMLNDQYKNKWMQMNVNVSANCGCGYKIYEWQWKQTHHQVIKYRRVSSHR